MRRLLRLLSAGAAAAQERRGRRRRMLLWLVGDGAVPQAAAEDRQCLIVALALLPATLRCIQELCVCGVLNWMG